MGCTKLGCSNNTIAGVERYLARVREQGTNGWAIVTPGNSADTPN